MFRTEYDFTLPLGYVDVDGELHREGVMRLATAADEILPLKDPRVRSNEAYLSVIVLSRVITRLGAIDTVNPGLIEKLFAADLGYLQDFYNGINRPEPAPPVTPGAGLGRESASANESRMETTAPGGLRATP